MSDTDDPQAAHEPAAIQPPQPPAQPVVYQQPQPPAYQQPGYQQPVYQNPQPPQPTAYEYQQTSTPPAAYPYQQPGNPQSIQPQYGYQPVQPVMVVTPVQPRGLSITSMVLALVSLFLGWSLLVPILALVLGILGLRKEPAGRGMALTGIIISAILLAVWAVVVGLVIITFIGAGVGAAASFG